ncbi:hypothetical protein [Glutamicibacter sp.]|uniref:hypothetical protein n=1 Tax=Glutamicibacter sp. TaxID=1931995 RepID=UPI0028BD4888|nr:hypothetical protein [Glutamicibacter sp.]
MAAEHELLDDVMGLVSLHAQAVLVAMLEQSSGKLMFIHVSEPNENLHSVDLLDSEFRIDRFMHEVAQKGGVTFRVKYWKYSAVAHFIPEFQVSADLVRTSYHRTLVN